MHVFTPPQKKQEVLREAHAGEVRILTEAYEKQLLSPVSSLLRGDLIRSLLINLESFKLMMLEEIQAHQSHHTRFEFLFSPTCHESHFCRRGLRADSSTVPT